MINNSSNLRYRVIDTIKHVKAIKDSTYKYHTKLSNNDNYITEIKNSKIIGKIRHYPPTTREWPNSGYYYNKNHVKELFNKRESAKLIINYNYGINNLRHATKIRSRRMNNFIIRSSSKKIIISNLEIKQTNDKVNITYYIYDRERQSIIRNLYFYNRKPSLHNLWLTSQNEKIIDSLGKYGNLSKVFLKRKGKKINGNTLRKKFPYNSINLKNEMDFLKFRTLNLLNKFSYLNKYFMFLFLTHMLSVFKIKVFISFSDNKNKTNSEENKNIEYLEKITHSLPKLLILIDSRISKVNIMEGNDINLDKLKLIVNEQNNSVSRKNISIEKLNVFLWSIVINKLINTKLISRKQINLLHLSFRNDFYKKIIIKHFKKSTRMFNYFTKLELNKSKYNALLDNVKTLISKIYNKKTELNVVNLKYIHLNSDIYTQAIATKLKKKTNALKILRKSLKLVKIPYNILLLDKEKNLNNLDYLNTHKNLDLTRLVPNYFSKNDPHKDQINNIISVIFPNSTLHNSFNDDPSSDKKNKIINILNTVKHKWIKGIRFEIAGRLTRRNTASRSLFKFRYKGNLNNKQYYAELDSLKTMSSVMLRNCVKSNSQYTLVKSKRRIGSFGIKSWISSY